MKHTDFEKKWEDWTEQHTQNARSILVPLGQNATVAAILAKYDGFYANVISSETLIQSFYSDYQKEAE